MGAMMQTMVDQVVTDAAVSGLAPAHADLFKAMGNAIINHIVANGTSAVAVLSVSGVTTGPGVSGSGTGNLV